MASLEEIKNSLNRLSQFAKAYALQISNIIHNQRANEIYLISNIGYTCDKYTSDTRHSPRSEIEQFHYKRVPITRRILDAENIKAALDAGYGDGNILTAIRCLNNAMTNLPISPDLVRNIKIRRYIEGLRQIGATSIAGYAMVANIHNTTTQRPQRSVDTKHNDLFVIKSPRQIDDTSLANQIHEYFVGVFGTNKLRNRIPNFAFMLGLFRCSPPYIDNKNALTYCQNDGQMNQTQYLIYENVTDRDGQSVTFSQFIINGCTFEEYLNILTQLVLALEYAYVEIDFTHYDLHADNVLIRTLNEEILIPYRVDRRSAKPIEECTQNNCVQNKKVIYLRTKYVATIIDLGRSHIVYEGQHYGYALYEAGIFPDRSYPMYDVYKILMFSLAKAAFGNKQPQSLKGLSEQQIESNLVNPDVYVYGKELITYFYEFGSQSSARSPIKYRDIMTGRYQAESMTPTQSVGYSSGRYQTQQRSSPMQMSPQRLSAVKYLIETRNYFYNLPLDTKYDGRPIYFYKFMMDKFSSVMNRFISHSPLNNVSIYGCANTGTCISLNTALTKFSDPITQHLNDPYVYYEMISTSRHQIVRNPERYPKYIAILQADRDVLLEELNKTMNGYKIMSFTNTQYPQNLEQSFLSEYDKFVSKTVKGVDIVTSIEHIIAIIEKLNQIYPEKAVEMIPPSVSPFGAVSGVGFRYREIPEIELYSLRNIIGKLDKGVNNIMIDVNNMSNLNSNDVKKINPNATAMFKKYNSLPKSISKV